MTQHQLVIEYIKEFGKIIPAKMGGRIYKGIMFGSETGKRCRELRKKGILTSHGEGKFEVFALTDKLTSNDVEPSTGNELPKPVQTPLIGLNLPSSNTFKSHYDN